MFGRKLKTSKRAALSTNSAIPLVVVMAIVAAASAGLGVLAGVATIGIGIGLSAVVAGIVAYMTASKQPITTSVPLKTILGLVGLAVLVGLEYIFNAGSTITEATAIAGASVAVTYLATELAPYNPAAPTPPSP